MRVEKSKSDYLKSPLNRDEIALLREQQKKWRESEKRYSIYFVIVAVCVPLTILAIISTWIDLLIGMAVSFVLYAGFKMWLPVLLDKLYPCSVVIDGEEVVTPWCNGLVSTTIAAGSRIVRDFESTLQKLERVPVQFERQLIEHES